MADFAQSFYVNEENISNTSLTANTKEFAKALLHKQSSFKKKKNPQRWIPTGFWKG